MPLDQRVVVCVNVCFAICGQVTVQTASLVEVPDIIDVPRAPNPSVAPSQTLGIA